MARTTIKELEARLDCALNAIDTLADNHQNQINANLSCINELSDRLDKAASFCKKQAEQLSYSLQRQGVLHARLDKASFICKDLITRIDKLET